MEQIFLQEQMNTQLDLLGGKPEAKVMNGKPVFNVPAKTVLNLDSGFKHKLLCDGPTFSMGTSCGFSCTFCYVEDMVRKLMVLPMMAAPAASGLGHSEIVIRRAQGLGILRDQLTDGKGRPKFKNESGWLALTPALSPEEREKNRSEGKGLLALTPALSPGEREKTAAPLKNQALFGRAVCYASPLVDVAANVSLMEETIEACRTILELTHWDIRLLSKSNLLPRLAEGLEKSAGKWGPKKRMIYGVSTGTLEDGLARSFEVGTAPVSKRLASLYWLQDNGFRTFGMICPSLPQRDYKGFARGMASAIRAERCEHVWAEVMNLRGESFSRTIQALREGNFSWEADALIEVSQDKGAWEEYARATFLAHAGVLPKGKLRFLQYVSAGSRAWWAEREGKGAVLL